MGFAWGGMHHLHDRDLYHLPLTAFPGCAGQWWAVLSFLLVWVRGAAPWCRQVLCFCIHFVWFIGYAFLGAPRWIYLPTMRVVYPHICHLQSEVDRGGLQHGPVRLQPSPVRLQPSPVRLQPSSAGERRRIRWSQCARALATGQGPGSCSAWPCRHVGCALGSYGGASADAAGADLHLKTPA